MGEVFYGAFNAASHGPETAPTSVATALSGQEIRSVATNLLGNGKPQLSSEASEWVDKRLHGVRYKGVNVLTVDWDPVYEPVMDAELVGLFQSPSVSGVAVEYFTPELAARAKKIPIVGRVLEHAVKEPVREGNIHKKGTLTYLTQYKRRLQFARSLSDTLAAADKTAVCFDIANKPTYMLLREGSMFAQIALGRRLGRALDARSTTDTKRMYERAGVRTALLWQVFKTGMQMFRKGIYRPDELTGFDQFQLHLEDARRLVIAEGLIQHIDRETAAGNLRKGSTLLVTYPAAHNLRIRNYMERITKQDGGKALKVKDLAYRLVSDPILEFKERAYRYQGGKWKQTGAYKINKQA